MGYVPSLQLYNVLRKPYARFINEFMFNLLLEYTKFVSFIFFVILYYLSAVRCNTAVVVFDVLSFQL